MLLVTAFAVTGAFAAEPKVRVLATTYPVYLLTRAVTQTSPDVQVDLLIPAQTGCPHDYALTPKDMQKLSKANVVIINGLGLEAFLEKPLAAAGKKIAVIDSSKGINAIVEEHDEDHDADHDKADAAHKDDHNTAAAAKGHDHAQEHGHGHDHGHDHGGLNPHAFSSPLQAAVMARNIGRGLAAAAPVAAKTARRPRKPTPQSLRPWASAWPQWEPVPPTRMWWPCTMEWPTLCAMPG
ncbi:MAG: metal ABC transporter substrate-binding protein [Desulfovibrio sp.]